MVKKKKPEEEFFDELRRKAEDAKMTGFEISKLAAETGTTLGKELAKMGKKKFEETLTAAKIAATTPKQNLELLEKLGKLKKSGLISLLDFDGKNKEILGRI